MKYAIIAAGEGSRLAAEGIALPKPLVEVDGQPLIDRLLRIFLDNDAEEIVVICNDLTPLNRRLLRAERLDFVIDQDFPSQVCEAILTLEEKLVRGRSPRTAVEHVSTSVITPEMV